METYSGKYMETTSTNSFIFMVDGNSGKSHENMDDLDVATIFGNLQILHFVDGFHPNPPKKTSPSHHHLPWKTRIPKASPPRLPPSVCMAKSPLISGVNWWRPRVSLMKISCFVTSRSCREEMNKCEKDHRETPRTIC